MCGVQCSHPRRLLASQLQPILTALVLLLPCGRSPHLASQWTRILLHGQGPSLSRHGHPWTPPSLPVCSCNPTFHVRQALFAAKLPGYLLSSLSVGSLVIGFSVGGIASLVTSYATSADTRKTVWYIVSPFMQSLAFLLAFFCSLRAAERCAARGLTRGRGFPLHCADADRRRADRLPHRCSPPPVLSRFFHVYAPRCLITPPNERDTHPLEVRRHCLFAWYEIFMLLVSFTTGSAVALLRIAKGLIVLAVSLLSLNRPAYNLEATCFRDAMYSAYAATCILEKLDEDNRARKSPHGTRVRACREEQRRASPPVRCPFISRKAMCAPPTRGQELGRPTQVTNATTSCWSHSDHRRRRHSRHRRSAARRCGGRRSASSFFSCRTSS